MDISAGTTATEKRNPHKTKKPLESDNRAKPPCRGTIRVYLLRTRSSKRVIRTAVMKRRINSSSSHKNNSNKSLNSPRATSYNKNPNKTSPHHNYPHNSINSPTTSPNKTTNTTPNISTTTQTLPQIRSSLYPTWKKKSKMMMRNSRKKSDNRTSTLSPLTRKRWNTCSHKARREVLITVITMKRLVRVS